MTLDLNASNGIKDNPGRGISPLGNSTSKVLSAIAIYGANSSGKSNLLRALGTMRRMVLDSVRLNDNESLPYDPFVLSTREQRPTRFELSYYEPIARATFVYGFEYTEEAIQKEWLQAKWPGRSEKRLIERTPAGVMLDEIAFSEGIRARELPLNKNRLFLSLAGQAGGEISNSVIKWFRDDLIVISGIRDTYSRYTRKQVMDSPETKLSVEDFLCKMSLGFNTFIPQRIDFDNLGYPQGIPKELIAQMRRDPYIQISSVHNVYDETGVIVRTEQLDLDDQESAGTNKIFALSAPLLEALKQGKTLLIDELDSKMHPLISWRLAEMFNLPDENPHHAQLIFTTHDTNLLSSKLFRRDQIWFTEKDSVENTTLYSMMDAPEFKAKGVAPRNDTNYQKNYIQGKYGAIPYLTCSGLGD